MLTVIISLASLVFWIMIRFFEFESGQLINVLLNQTVRIIALIALIVGIVWYEWKFAQLLKKKKISQNENKDKDSLQVFINKNKGCKMAKKKYLVLICCLNILAFLLSLVVFILEIIDQTGIIRLCYYY